MSFWDAILTVVIIVAQSLLLLVAPSAAERDRFAARVLEDRNAYLSLDMWDGQDKQRQLAVLYGTDCYAGIDLSEAHDLTALELWFPDRDGNGGDLLDDLSAVALLVDHADDGVQLAARSGELVAGSSDCDGVGLHDSLARSMRAAAMAACGVLPAQRTNWKTG